MRSRGKSMLIENASVVLPDGVLEHASVKVEDGIITGVGKAGPAGTGRLIDARGMYVLPGLVDLHSDAIEKEVQPRPSASFPVNMAVFEMDKKVAACGITTMYHSISMIDNSTDLRDKDEAERVIREVSRLSPHLNVRTKVHARFDIQSTNAVQNVDRLLDDGCVQLFSIMDHTPGQGQFRKITAYTKEYMEKNSNPFTGLRAGTAAVPLHADHVLQLIRKCQAKGIPVASHDDDTLEKLDLVEAMGITISEFPVNLEAAASAASRGMHVALGSPNVVRGSSIGGNLSAREAIQAGYGDILCSDYAPMSLIHAVYTIERMGVPLFEAVNMASLNPAMAAGISEVTGSLEAGKSADLIIVDTREEVPKIMKTFVEGREVYSTWRSPGAIPPAVDGYRASKGRLA